MSAINIVSVRAMTPDASPRRIASPLIATTRLSTVARGLGALTVARLGPNDGAIGRDSGTRSCVRADSSSISFTTRSSMATSACRSVLFEEHLWRSGHGAHLSDQGVESVGQARQL